MHKEIRDNQRHWGELIICCLTDRLIHHYKRVNYSIVWDIKDELPIYLKNTKDSSKGKNF
ncbi:MAG: hypothetical protein ACUVWP_07745 [bacterium]